MTDGAGESGPTGAADGRDGRPTLTFAVAQPETVAHDVPRNAEAHATAIRTARARVVVFPELSLTGYEFDAEPIGEGDSRLGAIRAACAETGSLALIGAPVADPAQRRFIGIVAVDGAGARVAYRKMYLGGAEPECFVAGSDPSVVEVDGWRLGLAVCRDTGIPAHAAATAALGMDVYVAGVLEFAHDAAVPEERARRIAATQHVWVAIASFAGPTGGGYAETAGGSGIWSPDGVAVARAGSEPGDVVRAVLR
jgi:predicted amidohydrolase